MEHQKLKNGRKMKVGRTAAPTTKKTKTTKNEEKKTMFAVLRLHTNVDIDTNFNPFPWLNGTTHKNVDLKFVDGMAGCIPVFETEETAQKHAEGRYSIIKIEVGNV